MFVSYSWTDSRDFARSLVRWLEAEGYRPWMDVEGGVESERDFDVEIEKGIRGSDVMIAVLSPGSLDPEVSFCRREWL